MKVHRKREKRKQREMGEKLRARHQLSDLITLQCEMQLSAEMETVSKVARSRAKGGNCVAEGPLRILSHF